MGGGETAVDAAASSIRDHRSRSFRDVIAFRTQATEKEGAETPLLCGIVSVCRTFVTPFPDG